MQGGEGRTFRSRVRATFTNLLILSLSVLAALGVSELAVRWMAPQQLIQIRPDVWQPTDTLGWTHRPNLETRINTGEGPVRLFTDRDGFRVGRAGRREADIQVLLIGDSFMAAFQVEHEQSVAGLMESGLSERLRRPVAVRNAAVDGWDPPHYVLRARRELSRDPYDAVVVAVFMGNDVVGWTRDSFPPREALERHSLRLPRDLSSGELIDAIAYPVNDLLEVRSHLFILLKNQLRVLLMRLGLTARYFPEVLKPETADEPWWGITADLLARVDSMGRAQSVPTVFALIPHHVQVDREEFGDYAASFGMDPEAVDIDQPNRLLGRELVKRGLHVVDALPAFRLAASRGVRLYGTVDPHFTTDGHLELWRLLEDTMVELLEAPEAGRPGPQLRGRSGTDPGYP
jgi:hypothetical protein